MTKIKLLDTFAWVGGFHLALEQSIWKENVECIWYSEIDKFAKQVYSERFQDSKDLWSITELDIDWLEDFDLLTGWFPCQDVSVAWKQSLEWWRTILVEYLLQILEKKQPKYFVFENVKWLMGKKFTEFRESIFLRMRDAWYSCNYEVLNTKNFWLPQNRERVFIVGRLNEPSNFKFPKWKELTTFLPDILEGEVEEKYYINRDKLWQESLNKIYDKITPLLDIMEFWIRIPKIIQKVWDRDKNYWGVKDIAYCIPANPMSDRWQLVLQWDDKIRKLTPTECARLQWFPDNWSTDYVSNSQAYKQMWNAISVPVVKAIFDNLLEDERI